MTISHHLYGGVAEIPLCDKFLLVGDVETSRGEGLDDGIVSQQRLGGVAAQDQAPGAAVELGRQQQGCHGGLQVLLVILVPVEGLLQVLGDAVCSYTHTHTHTHTGEALR